MASHNTPERHQHLQEGTFQFRVSNSHTGRPRKFHTRGNSQSPSYPERGDRLGQFGGSDLCIPSTAPPPNSGEKELMGLTAGGWLRESSAKGFPGELRVQSLWPGWGWRVPPEREEGRKDRQAQDQALSCPLQSRASGGGGTCGGLRHGAPSCHPGGE